MTPTQVLTVQPEDVLAFWREAGPSRWFRKDEVFDTQFRERFLHSHQAAVSGDFASWAGSASGALALLILLDQFPRNSFRGSPRMFESDEMAREVAREAIARGFDMQVEPQLRNFLYLPFMHSESLPDQDRAVELTRTLGDDPYRFAVLHRDIIFRFGRFPHRNAVLGRATTPDEQKFLDEGGFAG
jgi:uncharacterized protein (DUF924 family)